MDERSILLDLLPEECKEPLRSQVHDFKRGRRSGYYSYSRHKASASDSWYQYAKVLINYPRTLTYCDEQYHIVDVTCGIRNADDQLLLIRELTDQEAYEAVSNEKDNWRYWKYVFYDPEECKFFRFMAISADYQEDEAYKHYWIESVEDLIVKRCWDVQHSDNSIRKILKTLKNRKYWEEVHKERREEIGNYDMCGRCYKHRCCCEEGSRDLKYTVNPHSMSVEVSKGFRTLDFTMDEVAELASFFATAKSEIKKAKVAELKERAEDLAKQLAEAEAL